MSTSDNMTKTAMFTMKLAADLHAEFMAAAEASHRPASQVVRELMREFIQRQQNRDAHRDFLHKKVDLARACVDTGSGKTNDEVEADFAARRARAAARVNDRA